MSISSFFTDIFKTGTQYEKGLYQKKIPDETGFENRIHLRVDQDGTGVLWVNASQTFYLNESASLMAWCLMNNFSDEKIIRTLKKNYPNDSDKVIEDFKNFAPELKSMLEGKSNVCDLCQSGIDSDMPFSANPSAPYPAAGGVADGMFRRGCAP